MIVVQNLAFAACFRTCFYCTALLYWLALAHPSSLSHSFPRWWFFFSWLRSSPDIKIDPKYSHHPSPNLASRRLPALQPCPTDTQQRPRRRRGRWRGWKRVGRLLPRPTLSVLSPAALSARPRSPWLPRYPDPLWGHWAEVTGSGQEVPTWHHHQGESGGRTLEERTHLKCLSFARHDSVRNKNCNIKRRPTFSGFLHEV